jgi:uncharacterized protein
MDRLARMEVRELRPPAGGRLVVGVAKGFRERLQGLAGLPEPAGGAALLIPRCRAVHTVGMRFSLDVLFVTLEGGSLLVHEARRDVPPFRFVRASRKARRHSGLAVLEVAAGTLAATLKT